MLPAMTLSSPPQKELPAAEAFEEPRSATTTVSDLTLADLDTLPGSQLGGNDAVLPKKASFEASNALAPSQPPNLSFWRLFAAHFG
jgi:hypothetical protein